MDEPKSYRDRSAWREEQKGIQETIRVFRDFYLQRMGDANARKEFHHLGELITEGVWIPFETLEIERQLMLLGGVGLTSIVDYFIELEKGEAEGGTISRRPNSITCGFSTNMPVEGQTFFFTNETIPDHFEQLLGLYQNQKAPFPFLLSQGISTSYYQKLTAEAKKNWEECSRIKGEILNSEPRFKGFDHNRSLAHYVLNYCGLKPAGFLLKTCSGLIGNSSTG